MHILQGIAESLLFYHPAVWWISNQIRAEREHCCDDLAVAASGDVLVYARALAELESMRPALFKAALSANGGSLLRRIRRLTNPVATHRPAGWGAAWSLGAPLLLGIAGVAVTGAQGQSRPVVNLDTVWADAAKQGDMKLEVHGLGRLTSGHMAALKVAETHIQDVRQGEPAMIGSASLARPRLVLGLRPSSWLKTSAVSATSPRRVLICPTVAQAETGRTRRGIERMASPTTPPRPVGSGQLPGVGRSDASAAAAITPHR